MPNYNLPISSEDEAKLYAAIRSLPQVKRWRCFQCKQECASSTLRVYATCENCGELTKLRSFGGEIDVEDLILIILQWLAQAGVTIPQEFKSLVYNNWDDWDEYYDYHEE